MVAVEVVEGWFANPKRPMVNVIVDEPLMLMFESCGRIPLAVQEPEAVELPFPGPVQKNTMLPKVEAEAEALSGCAPLRIPCTLDWVWLPGPSAVVLKALTLRMSLPAPGMDTNWLLLVLELFVPTTQLLARLTVMTPWAVAALARQERP